MMHKDEININEVIVKRLISEQFPLYDSMAIRKINSIGTVNAIFMLGEEYCVRLPRLKWANESLQRELTVLPIISKNVALALPEAVAKGNPNADYPLNWAIYRWIPGETYDNSLVNETETAIALAKFITELRSIQSLDKAPKAGRKPLHELCDITIKAITECDGDIDCERALRLWRELLNTEPWDGNPVWIHADLLKPNLIVSGGRLFAVIDFGSAGIGDSAFDIIAAWTVLTSKTRGLFRSLLDVDEHTWRRAKAYALHQAALTIPYYRNSNPIFAEQAKNTINNILGDYPCC